MADLSIVFMGTPEFAVPSLESLQARFGVRAVVTVPDKPQGRGLKMMPSPVKQKAMELGIPVLQPESLKDDAFADELKAFNPDIIVVIAFRILPEQVFSIPKLGCFNIHGSLLPKYRGAAPINHAIINGETESGLTSFLLAKKVDTGNMLLQRKLPIPGGFTAGDLHDALMPIAAELALDTCELLIRVDYQPIMQDESLACPAPKLFPEQCRIDWTQPADKVKNFIHGLSPYPGAWTLTGGERMKIYRAEIGVSKGNPGDFLFGSGKIEVYCGVGSLHIIELQAPGKKTMNAPDFLRGYRGPEKGHFDL